MLTVSQANAPCHNNEIPGSLRNQWLFVAIDGVKVMVAAAFTRHEAARPANQYMMHGEAWDIVNDGSTCSQSQVDRRWDPAGVQLAKSTRYRRILPSYVTF
jgi:hypothetical protein